MPRADRPLQGACPDLTRCCRPVLLLIGRHGAEVIKIEEPGKGDDTRSWPPFLGGEATYFLSVNRNKQSLTLNLKTPAGCDILTRLARKSDVVLENFRTGTMERLGLGYKTLARLNPKLVYCAISGFGESGPEAGRAGYDLVVQAESGIMDITGFEDGPPVKVGTSIADLVAGMSAAHGITLALLARHRTKRGQKVEISMQDAMAALLTYQAGIYFGTGTKPGRAATASVDRALRGLPRRRRLSPSASPQLAVDAAARARAPRADEGSALRDRGRPRAEPRTCWCRASTSPRTRRPTTG